MFEVVFTYLVYTDQRYSVKVLKTGDILARGPDHEKLLDKLRCDAIQGPSDATQQR